MTTTKNKESTMATKIKSTEKPLVTGDGPTPEGNLPKVELSEDDQSPAIKPETIGELKEDNTGVKPTEDDKPLESSEGDTARLRPARNPRDLDPRPTTADEPIRYRVTENSRYFIAGSPHNFPKGLVIDDQNYNIADVKAQGIPLEPATKDDIDLSPGLGHRSV